MPTYRTHNHNQNVFSIRKVAASLAWNFTKSRDKKKIERRIRKINSLCQSTLDLITKNQRNYMGYVQSQYRVREKYLRAKRLQKENTYRLTAFSAKYHSDADTKWLNKCIHKRNLLDTMILYINNIIYEKMFDVEREYYARKGLSFLKSRNINSV